MTTETLFLTCTILHGCFLKDSKGYTVGHFANEQLAKQWCKENGYRIRIH